MKLKPILLITYENLSSTFFPHFSIQIQRQECFSIAPTTFLMKWNLSTLQAPTIFFHANQYSQCRCGKHPKFSCNLTKRSLIEYGQIIVDAAQFHDVMLLHKYQKSQPTFPLLSKTYEPEFHPASSTNIETYHFQIHCWNVLVTGQINLF